LRGRRFYFVITLIISFGRIAQLACSNTRSLLHGRINTFHDKRIVLDADAFRVLNDSSVALNGIHLCSGDNFSICVQSRKARFFIQGIDSWCLPSQDL